MNPLYQQLLGGTAQRSTPQSGQAPVFNNPIQKANYILRTLTNPAAFVKQQFPDVPDNLMNDPNQILGYLQQTRGIDTNQLQQILGQFPFGGGR